MKILDKNIFYLFIIIVSSLLFIPFLGGVHLFDWDEINFAESAREMIVSGDYVTVRINYLPFWEKPPLFIWMQALSMKIFGVNEFAARFPNAVCGILTLIILFAIGKKYYNPKFAFIWILCYIGSFLPFLYFKSGIIDPWFNLFIFCGIFFFFRFVNENKNFLIIVSAISIGLGILTKGPVALLIFILVAGIYLIKIKFRFSFSFKNFLSFILALFLTGGFWFILQIVNGNFTIIQDFIIYQVRLFKTQDAGHGGFLFYHFVVLLIGVFPASVFALRNLFSFRKDENVRHDFKIWMIILFWIVLLLFTIVKTKIVHYSSLCYFPLTFLAALTIHKFYERKKATPAWINWIAITLTFIYSVIIIAIPFILKYKEHFYKYIKDDFAVGNLAAEVNWTGFEGLVGVVLIFGIIFFIRLSGRKRILHAVTALFICTSLFIYLVLMIYVPKIESYSQNAAIEFFKQIQHEDAYVSTIGYKSYAHYFYGNVLPQKNPMAPNKDWLLTGDIDKKAYFSSKITEKEKIQSQYPSLTLLYEKNGFVFWLREAHSK